MLIRGDKLNPRRRAKVLVGRRRSRAPAPNVLVCRRGDSYAVCLCGTAIVTCHKGGTVAVDHGGYDTPTTRARLDLCAIGGMGETERNGVHG